MSTRNNPGIDIATHHFRKKYSDRAFDKSEALGSCARTESVIELEILEGVRNLNLVSSLTTDHNKHLLVAFRLVSG